MPIHQGNGFILAETGGAEEITLTVSQIAGAHAPAAGVDGDRGAAGSAGQPVLGQTDSTSLPTSTDAPNAPCMPAAVSPVGGSQPHTNFQPYLCVNFIISLFGIFPSPT